MKTKEIDVWAHISILDGVDDGVHSVYLRKDVKPKGMEYYLPAKIIIELPDIKIELTESEFDRLAKEALGRAKHWEDVMVVLRDSLFGVTK